jgi:hypothetical protein
MSTQKRTMLLINVLGGIAVLFSYAYGLWTHPGSSDALWGGVPKSIQPLYSVGMIAAAAGYFAIAYFLLIRLDPEEARITKRYRFGIFNLFYAMILFPSALWMPLTFAMIETPSAGLWIATRITLLIVGLGSVGLLWGLLRLEPRTPRWAYWLAVAGSVAFSNQTAVLDALVWANYFPVP